MNFSELVPYHTAAFSHAGDYIAIAKDKDLQKEFYLQQIDLLEREEKEYQDRIAETTSTLDQIQDMVSQMFDATGLQTEDFKDLVGCNEINVNNLEAFLGCFEVVVDRMKKQNGGTATDLAEEENTDLLYAHEETAELIQTIDNDQDEIFKPNLAPNFRQHLSQIETVKLAANPAEVEDEMRQFTQKEFDNKAKQFTQIVLNKKKI